MEKHHLILFISKEASSQKKYSLNLLFPEIIVYNIKYITKKNKHSKIMFMPYKEIIKIVSQLLSYFSQL